MGLISLLWGIVALLWMLVAFLPALGWGNWFMIPFAVLGMLIGAVGLLFVSGDGGRRARTGLLLNVVAAVIGGLRLLLGGGVL